MRGGRLSLNLAYIHNRFLSRQGLSNDSTTNTLTANGRGEIWDRVAFVDVSSSMSRQVIDPTQQTTNTDTGGGTNRTTVHTISVEPFFLHHFGTWLETESRNTFSLTRSRSDAITNTRVNGARFTANSGRRFTVFTFGGTFDQQKQIRDGDAPRTITRTINTNYRLQLSRKISLIGSVGRETIDDPLLDEEPNGLIWDAGISTQPNSRSSLQFTVGDRFDTTTFGLDASYRLSSRTSMSATYSESITTSQEQLNEDLSFLVSDGAGGFIDSRTGLAFDPANATFGFQTTLFRQRVFNFQMSTSRRRGSYSAGINWERRKTDTTGILDRVVGLNLSASRSLSPRLSASATGSFSFHDFGTADQREDKTFSFNATLSYVLMKDTSTSLSYTRSQTHSNIGSNNFRENTVTVNLSRTF